MQVRLFGPFFVFRLLVIVSAGQHQQSSQQHSSCGTEKPFRLRPAPFLSVPTATNPPSVSRLTSLVLTPPQLLSPEEQPNHEPNSFVFRTFGEVTHPRPVPRTVPKLIPPPVFKSEPQFLPQKFYQPQQPFNQPQQLFNQPQQLFNLPQHLSYLLPQSQPILAQPKPIPSIPFKHGPFHPFPGMSRPMFPEVRRSDQFYSFSSVAEVPKKLAFDSPDQSLPHYVKQAPRRPPPVPVPGFGSQGKGLNRRRNQNAVDNRVLFAEDGQSKGYDKNVIRKQKIVYGNGWKPTIPKPTPAGQSNQWFYNANANSWTRQLVYHNEKTNNN